MTQPEKTTLPVHKKRVRRLPNKDIGITIGASNAANIVTATLHIYGSYEGATPPTSYV